MALSDIVQSELETELSVNDLYAALSAAVKLQKSNTAIQAINNMSVVALEPDYLMDNMTSSSPVVVGSGHLANIILNVNSETGSVLIFDSPYPTAINPTGDYVTQARGFGPSGEDVHVTIVMAPEQVSFYPDADATNIFYTIFPLT